MKIIYKFNKNKEDFHLKKYHVHYVQNTRIFARKKYHREYVVRFKPFIFFLFRFFLLLIVYEKNAGW